MHYLPQRNFCNPQSARLAIARRVAVLFAAFWDNGLHGLARQILATRKMAAGACLFFLAASCVLTARLAVSPLFESGAVLQRGVPHPVWGEAQPDSVVSISFLGQTLEARADGAGRWQAELAPMQASSVGTDLVVQSNGERIVSSNVVVGEVWLCSGQSNMEWTMKNSPRLAQAKAADGLPTLRHFKVKRAVADSPSHTLEGAWAECSPATVADFSALAYHFGLKLNESLDVPVGLVNSSWGGTRIEPWMPQQATEHFDFIARNWQRVLASYPQRKADYEEARVKWREAAAQKKARGEPVGTDWPRPPAGPGTRETPSGLFNAMIAPLAPFPFAGVLWYQAEGNTGGHANYARMFPAMIEEWRNYWGRPQWPFIFVQLPNYRVPNDGADGVRWAQLRDAQEQALALPAVGMAVAIDDGVETDGHPPDKLVLGERLARIAEVAVYGTATGDATGPLLRAVEKEGDALRVRFTQAQSGLVVKGDTLTELVVIDKDGRPHAATGTVEGSTLLVRAQGVEPAGLRYAWRNAPRVTLYNGDGLPAAPFRWDAELSQP